jgi:hypothetical protein
MKTIAAASRIVTAVVVAASIAIAGCGEDTAVDPVVRETPAGPDTIPPAAINSLIVPVATKSTLALQWISPGDDGDTGQAASYDIRYHNSEITDLNWTDATPVVSPPAPKPGGSVEILVVKGLFSSRRYFFCIKTCDEAGNESAVSNNASGTTLAEFVAPAPVTDLAAQAVSDTEFRLTWTATGDDGVSGTASVYDIRYSTSRITSASFATATQLTGEPVPHTAGDPQHMQVGGFTPDINYYFAMRVGDELPNWSNLSNTYFGIAFGVEFLVYPTNVTNTDIPVSVHFRNSSAEQDVLVTISSQLYIGGGEWEWVVRRHLAQGTFEPGAHLVQWDYRDDEGNMVLWTFAQVRVDFYLDGVLIGRQALRRG